MLIDETVYFLEMASRDEIKAGKPGPKPAKLVQAGIDSCSLLRETFIRIGDLVGKGFQTRRIPPWSVEQWAERLNEPGVTAWLAYVENDVAGFLELESRPGGDLEIFVFGLVPEFVNKGFGGDILTRSVELAWAADTVDGTPVSRVWLHTSTRDHPHALPNYLARGFSIVATEQRQKEVQLKYTPPD